MGIKFIDPPGKRYPESILGSAAVAALGYFANREILPSSAWRAATIVDREDRSGGEEFLAQAWKAAEAAGQTRAPRARMVYCEDPIRPNLPPNSAEADEGPEIPEAPDADPGFFGASPDRWTLILKRQGEERREQIVAATWENAVEAARRCYEFNGWKITGCGRAGKYFSMKDVDASHPLAQEATKPVQQWRVYMEYWDDDPEPIKETSKMVRAADMDEARLIAEELYPGWRAIQILTADQATGADARARDENEAAAVSQAPGPGEPPGPIADAALNDPDTPEDLRRKVRYLLDKLPADAAVDYATAFLEEAERQVEVATARVGHMLTLLRVAHERQIRARGGFDPEEPEPYTTDKQTEALRKHVESMREFDRNPPPEPMPGED